ncbi:hypothetical protein MWN34_03345 [Ancylobacter sp. 6x-1]|uniref:Uncharacterized protein n=1 Tax=Ancylobacter crimeensis TaxID=2579147 RepID=A0ABT0D7L7_9HYPH|nr:hypothetical protein [Ancylobacter crimeensis]MCK0195940.1 hypothetical protein [Ancylobacter crimeensis]
MSADGVVVFESGWGTIIIARGLSTRGQFMKSSRGAELAYALRAYLLQGGSIERLAGFWAQNGGTRCSPAIAPLIAEVADAVDRGRLNAWIFRQPQMGSKADFNSLAEQAERGVQQSMRSSRRPPPPPTAATLAPAAGLGTPLAAALPVRSVGDMKLAERLAIVLRRTPDHLAGDLAEPFRAFVENPETLAMAVLAGILLTELHAVAAGEVIDGAVLTALIVCAVMRGESGYEAVHTTLAAAESVVRFLMLTFGAKTERDLDEAAKLLAQAVAAVGVAAIIFLFRRITGERQDGPKQKAGKGRPVAAMTEEERLRANQGKPLSGPAPAPNPTPPPHPTPPQLSQKPGSQAGPQAGRPSARELLAGQPHNTVEDIYKVAPKHQAKLAKAGQSIEAELGVDWKNPGIKDRETAAAKMERKKYRSVKQMSDIVRGGFVVDTPAQADAVVAKLGRRFDILDEGWKASDVGYVDRKVLVRFDDGTVGEVQIWNRAMYAAKDPGSKLYTQRRSLPAGDIRRQELERQERALYSAAVSESGEDWSAISAASGTGGN